MNPVLLDLSVLDSPSRYRGIGRYTITLATGLARADHGLEVAAIETLRPLRPGRVSTDLDGVLRRLTGTDRRCGSHAHWAWSVRLGMSVTARSVRAKLIHSPHPDATPVGPLGCPRVVTLHDLIPLLFPDRYAQDWREGFATGRRLLDRRRYGTADHLIAVSESSADDARRLLGIADDRISVVYPGVDLSRWSPTPDPDDEARRRRLGLGDRPYLLYVGGEDWRKNPEGMLRALAIARSRPGLGDLALVWAGRLRLQPHHAVPRLVARLGLQDALVLPGFVDDEALRALYRGALAQLFVSRYEGFGFPLVEAMAMGCPVITSGASSTGEVAGGAALLVPPEDPAAIADAIVGLADDAAECARLRQAGIVRAQRFSLERMARDTVRVYRAVVDRWAADRPGVRARTG